MHYLKTLMQLKDIGVDCDDKIKVTLDELHREMGFANYVAGEINNITIEINKAEDKSAEKVVKSIVESMERNLNKNYPDTVCTRTEKANEVKSPFDTIE